MTEFIEKQDMWMTVKIVRVGGSQAPYKPYEYTFQKKLKYTLADEIK